MFLEAGLLTRRSVRQYELGKKISREDIEDILKIAMYAPSARNCQPWEFIVIEDEDLKNQIAEIHPYAKFLKEASAAILVCGNVKEECDAGYWVVDTSAATENLLLAVHGKGLGACWCGVYPNQDRMEALADLLNLPSYLKPNGLIVIGYPKSIPPMAKDRFKPEKIHYNAFDKQEKSGKC